jgi:hypothetical protein
MLGRGDEADDVGLRTSVLEELVDGVAKVCAGIQASKVATYSGQLSIITPSPTGPWLAQPMQAAIDVATPVMLF